MKVKKKKDGWVLTIRLKASKIRPLTFVFWLIVILWFVPGKAW